MLYCNQLAHCTFIKMGELIVWRPIWLGARFTVTVPFVKLLLRLQWTRLEEALTFTGRFITGSERQTLCEQRNKG
jgi:hypothetical protein